MVGEDLTKRSSLLSYTDIEKNTHIYKIYIHILDIKTDTLSMMLHDSYFCNVIPS